MSDSQADARAVVLAVDPGRDKCGLAVVVGERVALRALCPTAEVGLTCRYLLTRYPQAALVVGHGTGAEAVCQHLRQACPQAQIASIEERDSTLQARQLYWSDHPPRGLLRLLPEGMRIPPRPVDDYAAVVLARRYLQRPGALSGP
ncbi:MAG: resolvase [Armatimonadetes bacterium]|nr:resolvase [Armatimonadota bacterium]